MDGGAGTFETRVIGQRYRVEDLLGRGSMGAVYRAQHVLTGAPVALKLINPSSGHPELVRARFLREVSVCAHIGHEGIVRVYDAGQASDGTLYLAMELLEGETFAERARRPGFTAGYGLNVLRAMLEPLAAAHAAGVVHRDIKPENVFLHRRSDGREQVKLLDFGIARDPRHPSGTRTDVGLGTPYYMSPEQATNARGVTAASDVWSAGVMLYWLLAGRLPFEAETPFNTLSLVCTTPHPPLPERPGQTSRGLAALVERALDKDPDRRPADAGALLGALDAVLGPTAAGDSFGAVRAGSSPHLSRPWAPPAPAGSSDEAIVGPPTVLPPPEPAPTPTEARMASIALPAPVTPARGRRAALLALALLLGVLVIGLARELVDQRRGVAYTPPPSPRPAEPTTAAVMPAREMPRTAPAPEDGEVVAEPAQEAPAEPAARAQTEPKPRRRATPRRRPSPRAAAPAEALRTATMAQAPEPETPAVTAGAEPEAAAAPEPEAEPELDAGAAPEAEPSPEPMPEPRALEAPPAPEPEEKPSQPFLTF